MRYALNLLQFYPSMETYPRFGTRGGNFVLPPTMSTSSRGWSKSEEQFNPLPIAQPLPPERATARKAVSWAIHSRSGMCGHGARRRDNRRPATAHPRAMGQIERHLTSEEFRQPESRLPEIV